VTVSVVPTVGSGTRFDPWKPLGWEPGAKSHRIVPGGAGGDRTQAIWILSTPNNIGDQRAEKVCDTLEDNASSAMRTVLEKHLGVTLDAPVKGYEDRGGRLQEKAGSANVIDLLATALLDPPGGAWNPLMPTTRGQYELILDGLRWRVPTIRGGATDDFNRADESTLSGGGNWGSGYGDWNNMALAGNAVRAAAADSDSAARWLANEFSGGGQYSQAVFGTLTDSFIFWSVCARMHPSSTTDESCYQVTSVYDASVLAYRIYEYNSSFGATELDTVTGNATSATFRIEANGTSLKGVRNGTDITNLAVTDATLDEATYTRVGIADYQGTGTLVTADNWEGGALGGAPAIRRYSLPATGVG
jgi:hypothetical protein